MCMDEAAHNRLREFTRDWSVPEKMVVEDEIAGRTTEMAPRQDRRRDPGRPWRTK